MNLKDDNIGIYSSNVSNRIASLANKYIPNKNGTVRTSDPSCTLSTQERDARTITLWNVTSSAAVASWSGRHQLQHSIASVGNPR